MTPEPMTPIGEAAAALHEGFTTMIAAGFTENQACKILGAMLAAGHTDSDDPS